MTYQAYDLLHFKECLLTKDEILEKSIIRLLKCFLSLTPITFQSQFLLSFLMQSNCSENPPIWKIGITSLPVPADLPTMDRLAGTGQLVTAISCVGGFLFFVFLNLWASILKDMRVWCITLDFLFKYVWVWCVKDCKNLVMNC